MKLQQPLNGGRLDRYPPAGCTLREFGNANARMFYQLRQNYHRLGICWEGDAFASLPLLFPNIGLVRQVNKTSIKSVAMDAIGLIFMKTHT